MNSLRATQNEFFQALLNLDERAPQQILPNHYLDANQRFKLYQDAYRLRLTEAMCDTYSSLHTLAGDEMFEHICLEYIYANTSQHFSIRQFGSNLADFLFTHDSFKSIPVLAEMAKFEWQLRNAFDGPDSKVLQKSDLLNYRLEEWADLCFKLVPTFSWISLRWNVPQIWKAIEQNENPILPEQSAKSANWIIWRPHLETKFRSVNPEELLLFNKLADSCRFEDLCAELETNGAAEPALSMASYLTRWLDDGLLASVWLLQ